MGAMSEIAIDLDRAGIGHNLPPEPTPLEGFTVHIDDLMETAQGFLDGGAIDNQALADVVSKVMDDCRRTRKDADAARAEEKRALDEQVKAIQAKWKPLIERCDLATKVCKDALQPFLDAQDIEKKRVADEARAEAMRKAEAAAAAARDADATNLAAQEHAVALAREAKQANTAANRAERDGARATGGARATTLRDNYQPVLVNALEAIRHYWKVNPQAFDSFLIDLARKDVASKKYTIPGFDIVNNRTVV